MIVDRNYLDHVKELNNQVSQTSLTVLLFREKDQRDGLGSHLSLSSPRLSLSDAVTHDVIKPDQYSKTDCVLRKIHSDHDFCAYTHTKKLRRNQVVRSSS